MLNSIEGIIETDRKEFVRWVNKQGNKGTLDLPYKALRYLTIPLNILHLSCNPKYVDILDDIKDIDYLSCLIYEPDAQELNTFNSLNDPFLQQYHQMIQKGELFETDFVWLRVSMTDELHIISYEDRSEFRNKGMASSFYRRLRYCASVMGFRFLTGLNDSDRNFKFFLKNGRFALDNLKPEKQQLFMEKHLKNYPDLNQFTIDFLDPKDIAEFVQM